MSHSLPDVPKRLPEMVAPFERTRIEPLVLSIRLPVITALGAEPSISTPARTLRMSLSRMVAPCTPGWIAKPGRDVGLAAPVHQHVRLAVGPDDLHVLDGDSVGGDIEGGLAGADRYRGVVVPAEREVRLVEVDLLRAVAAVDVDRRAVPRRGAALRDIHRVLDLRAIANVDHARSTGDGGRIQIAAQRDLSAVHFDAVRLLDARKVDRAGHHVRGIERREHDRAARGVQCPGVADRTAGDALVDRDLVQPAVERDRRGLRAGERDTSGLRHDVARVGYRRRDEGRKAGTGDGDVAGVGNGAAGRAGNGHRQHRRTP